MKIALIFTPLRLKNNWSTLIAQDEHIGIMPPLSLAYAAAIAEKSGHKVIIIDAVAERLSLKSVTQRIKEFSPDILGFTLTTYGFHQALSWIRSIKERVNIPVMVGGWHLSIYPRQTMHHAAIDYAVIGDAENILPDFLAALESGGSLHAVKGIAFKESGQVIITPAAASTTDLDTVPFPARHLLKNDLYYNILSRVKNFTVMLSARGCPYQCIFCDLNTRKFRMRSAKNFVDEIEIGYKEFGIREFDIYDSSFTIDNQRVLKICEEIIRRRLNVFWTVRSRIDTVDKDLLRSMAEAGCNTIMYGIESAHPGILRSLNKYNDADTVKQVISWSKESGIKTLGFFMLGAPGETPETADETIKLMTALDLDYVQVTKLTPFPNTKIYSMLLEKGFGDYWSEFTMDASKEKELPLINTALSCAEVRKLVRRAYLSFYFRPSYVIKALKRTRSLLELRNSLKAAIGLLFTNQ
ncbi:MAG: radical SAM protein [Candidatus Omnitrophica bacterium]|nr:radical SAM protein [Candidatus Omnitrophota bacterium]